MTCAYTPSQIDEYLDYISFPAQYRLVKSGTTPPPQTLEFLTLLGAYHLSAVPYENLTLHYSKSHAVSLDLQVIFKKIVTDKRGRGGYCMENCLFYLNILRGLGFNAYPTGARIRLRVGVIPHGDYIGWMHIVNIVTFPDGAKYVVDVSFGGDGPTKPMPLIHGVSQQNIGTQEIRFVHDHIPQLMHRSSSESLAFQRSTKLWIYQYRNSSAHEWNSYYCFSELEFLPQDFEVINCYASTSPDCFQTFTLLVVRFLRRDGDGEGTEKEEIHGKVMLVNGEVKRNTGGRTETVLSCTSEVERVEALRLYFGIELTEEERMGIRDRVTELTG